MSLEQLQTLPYSSDLNKKSTFRCRFAAETAIRYSGPSGRDIAERVSRSTSFPRAARPDGPAAGLGYRAAIGSAAADEGARRGGGEGLAAGRLQQCYAARAQHDDQKQSGH